jgi:transcriptional regulator with XRE-family HTH domain
VPKGQLFDDFLSEEVAADEALALEVRNAFDDMRLAVQLAMFRERMGISQQNLAIASKISQPMISRIERGDQQPKWPTILRLLGALGAQLTARPDGTVTLQTSPTPHETTLSAYATTLRIDESWNALTLSEVATTHDREWHRWFSEAMQMSGVGNQARQPAVSRARKVSVG